MTIKKTQKVLMQLLFVFTIALTCIIFTTYKASAIVVSGFNFEPGDIMVTSSTSSSGLTGHAGIVLPDGANIVHIAGPGYHPDKISISSWLNAYPKTKVVRTYHPMAGLGASYFGQNYFLEGAGRYADYAITSDITSRSTTYCSKLVWQCYDGAGISFKEAILNVVGQTVSYRTPIILSPYTFIDPMSLSYNGFSIVKSFNW